MAGYSATPLIRKLGIKPGWRVHVRNAPCDYGKLVGDLPEGVRLATRLGKSLDMIHCFTADRAVLARELPRFREHIVVDGVIWISWPKKSSRVPSTVSEDVVREIALPLGLVDVKVCAVDEVWSGLKLVIRKKLR